MDFGGCLPKALKADVFTEIPVGKSFCATLRKVSFLYLALQEATRPWT